MIIPEFKLIVSQMPGPPVFRHGAKAYQNLAADNLDLTNGVIFLYEPLICIDKPAGSGTQKTWPVQMFFAFQGSLQQDPGGVQDTRPALENAWQLSEQFFLRLKAFRYPMDDTRFVDQVLSLKRQEYTHEYDVDLHGVHATFDLVPLYFTPTCIV